MRSYSEPLDGKISQFSVDFIKKKKKKERKEKKKEKGNWWQHKNDSSYKPKQTLKKEENFVHFLRMRWTSREWDEPAENEMNRPRMRWTGREWDEKAEWSEQLTPGQSGWLGAAAVGSIPALALSHSQKKKKKKTAIFSATTVKIGETNGLHCDLTVNCTP